MAIELFQYFVFSYKSITMPRCSPKRKKIQAKKALPSPLLTLTPEMQSKIIDELDWPALMNLRATSRYFNSLPSRDQLQAKLEDFEKKIWEVSEDAKLT